MLEYEFGILPSSYRKILPQRLRILRKKAGYSQMELAERSGVSLGSLKRFESTGQISLDAFMHLLHVLGRIQDLDQVLKIDEELERVAKLFEKDK